MKKRKKRVNSSFSYRPFFIVVSVILLAIFAGKGIVASLEENILGTNTYLTKSSDSNGDSSGSSGSGSSDSSNGSDSGSGSSGSGSGSSGGDSSGSGYSGSDSQGTSGSTDSTRTETRSDTGIRTQTETKQGETRTEVRLSEEERIRTRTKDGETRIDITSGGIKVRLEQRDDRVIIKAEQEDGTETELEDDTIFKIEERLGKSGIKVATAGAEKFVVQRGDTGAVTNFPISIDLVTNTLTINTSTGSRAVAVLPDQAVQNIIAANVVSRIGGRAVVDEAVKNNLILIAQLITLGEQNGVTIYEINGISDQRLFGIIPVAIEKKVAVSVETGQVVSQETSFVNRILDALSL